MLRGLLGQKPPLTSTVTIKQAQEAQIAGEKGEKGGPVRAVHAADADADIEADIDIDVEIKMLLY